MADPAPTNEEIRRVMRHLSSLGASKGGRARADKLSQGRRREIAQKAARARWEKAETAVKKDGSE